MSELVFAKPPRGAYPVNLGYNDGWSLDLYRIQTDRRGRDWLKVKLWTPFGVKEPKNAAFWLQISLSGWIPPVKLPTGKPWAALWRQDKALEKWARDRCKAYGRAFKENRARKPGETPEEAAARGIRVVAPSGKGA